MNELFWFLLGGVYAWVIREGIKTYTNNCPTNVTIDWASIKQGMPKDGAIVVAGPQISVDWALIQRALETEGYTVIRRELH